MDYLAQDKSADYTELVRLMLEVSKVRDFSHLADLEDGKAKVRASQAAVEALRLELQGHKGMSCRTVSLIANSTASSGLFLFADIRGFSAWMKENQYEASALLDRYYGAAFAAFGARKEQRLHRRVSKLLGDGFFVVHEYQGSDANGLQEVLSPLISSIITFRIDFYQRLKRAALHGSGELKCAFGLSFGPCQRISIPGYPLDFVSHRINFASRLVSVANANMRLFLRKT